MQHADYFLNTHLKDHFLSQSQISPFSEQNGNSTVYVWMDASLAVRNGTNHLLFLHKNDSATRTKTHYLAKRISTTISQMNTTIIMQIIEVPNRPSVPNMLLLSKEAIAVIQVIFLHLQKHYLTFSEKNSTRSRKSSDGTKQHLFGD